MNKLSRFQAIGLALVVTVIWSFSWVLIKFGLQDNIAPLTFAGLRYTIAALILIMIILRSQERRLQLLKIQRRDVIQLISLGLVYYTTTQGLLFLSLRYLPAATYSLLLNFTSIVVMIGGIFFLKEYPNRVQVIAMMIFVAGVLFYFFPTSQPVLIGLVIGLLSMLSNAASSILGRAINRESTQSAVQITALSMGIGAPVLLIIAVLVEGWSPISLVGWGIIFWLAIVHTAIAFTLWNLTLGALSAAESSLINNTMLVQISLLAWVFLGETLSIREIIALATASVGIVVFHFRPKAKKVDS